MKKDIHPEDYRTVIFKDMTTGDSFLSRSTAPTKETATYEDGNHDPNDNLRNTGVNDESLENPGNRLAYKDMPAFTYYFSTIITIVIFAIIGAYVKQISLATELISDIGVVYVSYI